MAEEDKKGATPIKLSDFHKSLIPPGKFALEMDKLKSVPEELIREISKVGVPKDFERELMGAWPKEAPAHLRTVTVPKFSFGGEMLANFYNALKKVDNVVYHISEVHDPHTRRYNMAWEIRPLERDRGRVVTKPLVELRIKYDDFAFLEKVIDTRVFDFMETKGVIILYLYLGFCSANGDFFNTHSQLFGILDIRTHEENYYNIVRMLVMLVDERHLGFNLYAMQMEAEKMFLEFFI